MKIQNYSEELIEKIKNNQFEYKELRLEEYDFIDQVRALAEALKINTTVTKLNLWWNGIKSEGARYLAEALKINTTLTQLDLEHNEIGGEGAKAIAEMLEINTTLTNLDLGNNGIGDDRANALAEALKINATLTQLDLWHNEIGGKGAKALAEMLKINATLTQLDLWHNEIGGEGAKALAEALKINTTLIKINLRVNQIEDKELGIIKEGIIKEGIAINKLLVKCDPLSKQFQKYKALMQNEEALKVYPYAEKLIRVISEIEIMLKVLSSYEPRAIYEIESKEGAKLGIKSYQELENIYDQNGKLKLDKSEWGKIEEFTEEDVVTLRFYQAHPEYQKTGGYIRKLLSMSLKELQAKMPPDSEGWKILLSFSKTELPIPKDIREGLKDLFSEVGFEGMEEQSVNDVQLEEGWELPELIKVPEWEGEKTQGNEAIVANNETHAQGSLLIGEVAGSSSTKTEVSDFVSH